MNWLTNFVKPKLSALVKRKDVPENLWQNCPSCANMLHHKDLKENLRVCNTCDYHFRMSAEDRIKLIFSKEDTKEIELDKISDDPLNFSDKKKYKDRLKEYRKKTKREDAFILLDTKIGQSEIICGLMNFSFMGGSMGRAVGSAIVKGVNLSIQQQKPYILFTCSGGARMDENQHSLQSLPKTTIACQMVKDAKLPYIVVNTNPTSGGVSASFGSLGSITLAEPNALICFAGPRVISNTVGETLPDGFQRSEYLLEHGFIDQVVHRKELKDKLSQIISLLLKRVA